MDICDKKNKIQDLLNEIYGEYNRMNETKIQSKCETDLEMRTMINNIRSLETSVLDKDNRIRCLEKTICDYDKISEDLNSKLELKEEYDKENNRHDMLRILSKDNSEKDREIERLNNLLDFHKKEKKNKKIDTILEIVSKKDKDENIKLQEVVESVDKETGEVNPNFIYPLESEPSPGGSINSETEIKSPIKKEEEVKKEEVIKETTQEVEENIKKIERIGVPNKKEEKKEEKENKEEVVKEEVKEENKEEENKEEIKEEKKEEVKGEEKKDEIKSEVKEEEEKILMRVKSKNIYYFVYKGDNPQNLYEYNEEKRADKIIGKRTRIDGKYKLELF